MSLRGLGARRTLVLIDGKRMPYGGVNDSAADLNQIPASMVERVEVLTGGASAVYGSDAVAGVVNFIMKKDFEGVEFEAQYGTYQHNNDFGGPGEVKLRDVIAGRAATNPSQFRCRTTTSPTARASSSASPWAPRPRTAAATSRPTPPCATTRQCCSATVTTRPARWSRTRHIVHLRSTGNESVVRLQRLRTNFTGYLGDFGLNLTP